MAREMLINVAEMEECRIAVVVNGVLEELYVERTGLASRVGNIYKGKVLNIEPSIQAAFVDFGISKNGFLHISDLHPKYFPGQKENLAVSVGRRESLKNRPPIQECLKKGQNIIVQVIKEGLKTKGPTLNTYLSLPGKYLVMMPWMSQLGVSQKIEDDEEKRKLRQLLLDCKPPKGFGFIIRTAGRECSKRDMQSDLRYLSRLWTAIQKRLTSAGSPAEIYQESDLVIRTLRDVFNSSISNIVCDSENISRKIRDFLKIAMPRMKTRVTYYSGKTPLFHRYRIESEISRIESNQVELKSGGSIVIEQTEALVAIDVNSGRYRKRKNAEQTAFEINMEAAAEIPRQLRLRDLGGVIVCDFIDMRAEKHRRQVERVFRGAVKVDRARSKVLRMSRFGIVEMTRQRLRPSLQSSSYLACPQCGGTGVVKSHEALSVGIIRLLNLATANKDVRRIELMVPPDVAGFLHNEKRAAIAHIEHNTGKRVMINAQAAYAGGKHSMICYDGRGSVVKF